MQSIAEKMKQKARELLKTGAVDAVLGWKKGELSYDAAPAFFSTPEALEDMVYNGFCGSNLSKYLVDRNREKGKTLVFLKPCDTYSLNQLLAEHRVDREKIHVVGIGCDGMLDVEKLRVKGFKGFLSIEEKEDKLSINTLYDTNGSFERQEALLEKCLSCKGKEHKVSDELLGAELSRENKDFDRFAQVADIEGMRPDERFAFWRGWLSMCIRCNACRNACPSCNCLKCIFDNAQSGVGAKANTTDFEENMYHIVRAFHVAGRCSDCGECSRVCPQAIPLHLLNRKFIKDINTLYGDFQAGELPPGDDVLASPLLRFEFSDSEPNVISKGGGKK